MYVIGAGASKELNLPTGEELIKNIADRLDYEFDAFGYPESGDDDIYQAIRIHASDTAELDKYFIAAKTIKKGIILTKSIDTYIHNHRGDSYIAKCGKLAITRAILDEERNSTLYNAINSRPSHLNIPNTWLIPFHKNLTEGCDIKEIEERLKSITLIILNYDRCVEQFLYNALKQHYNTNDSKASQLMSNLNIYHPYGTVGKLKTSIINGVKFGAKLSPEKLLDISNEIKTFTEGITEKTNISEIKKHMSNAEKLIFIGFAFHKMNMEILKPNPPASSYPIFYASTYGFSDFDKKEIKKEIKKLYYNRDIGFVEAQFFMSNKDQTCFDFFNEFQKGLSF